MKFFVGGIAFDSKKAVVEAVRIILYAYKPGTTIVGEHERFMLDLFERHPEWVSKVGVGVASVEVERNMGSMGFWLTRVDGTRTDISFLKCIVPQSHEQMVRAAFRHEVMDQIHSFKREFLVPGIRCEVTGDLLFPYNVHVDHAPPVFHELVSRFVIEHGLSFDSISLTPTLDGEAGGRRLVDRSIAGAWHSFHRAHARLRLVTKKANLGILRRKGRTGEKP